MPRYNRKSFRPSGFGRVGKYKHRTRWQAFSKGFSKGYNGVMRTASNALKIAKQLKSVVNVEYKYVDTGATEIPNATVIPLAPNSAISCVMNAVGQGDDKNQRNGNSIRMKSVSGSFDISRNAAFQGTQLVRYMICLYKDADGGMPVMSKVFAQPGAFNTMRNREYPYEIYILKQGRIQVDIIQKDYKHISFNINLNGHTKYIDDGDAYDSISRNTLIFFAWSDTDTNSPKILNWQSRFSYIDN